MADAQIFSGGLQISGLVVGGLGFDPLSSHV